MPAFTKETAREMGRRGGKARKRPVAKDAAALKVFRDATPELAKELLDAAMARGTWETEFEVVVGRKEDGQLVTRMLPVLDAKDRAQLIVRCLEFGIGRPSTRKQESAKDEAEEERTDGLVIT